MRRRDAVMPPKKSFDELELELKQKEHAQLLTEYEASHEALLTNLDTQQRTRLRALLEQLAPQIRQLEQEISTLEARSAGKTPSPPMPAADRASPVPTNPSQLSPLQAALERARTFNGRRNHHWTPYIVKLGELDPHTKLPDMEFCLVPAGKFMMGEGNEAHEQIITQPYWIARYPVTHAEYEKVMGKNPSAFKDAQHPVENISWFKAMEFCRSLTHLTPNPSPISERGIIRLPTELEWEYAARGVESWVYPWGNDWQPDDVVYDDNSNGQTAVVGSKPNGKSWVGALDMAGNVWEWCSSLYAPYPYRADDGREADTGSSSDVLRVLRGGSWDTNNKVSFRGANRGCLNIMFVGLDFGFRLARSW
jgi:formylglycine-generating enzyme required for sulfatase activity